MYSSMNTAPNTNYLGCHVSWHSKNTFDLKINMAFVYIWYTRTALLFAKLILYKNNSMYPSKLMGQCAKT